MKKTSFKPVFKPLQILLTALLTPFLFCASASAAPNYHLLGWVNTFVPGAGEVMLGNPGLGIVQAVSEVGTFSIGYANSRRSPLTLDGVPEDIPSPQVTKKRISTRAQYCRIHPTDVICSQGSPNDKLLISTFSSTPISIQKSLSADILQEFGIKYHMVNVFNAYREAAQGVPNIDRTPTGELFLSPFRGSVLSEPEVFIPLGISVAAVFASYYFTVKDGLPAGPKLTKGSNRLYATTYAVVFPVGSAVPEEMFYRGFIQNEAYSLVPSPWFAIPVSTLAYTLSHTGDEMPTAAITGLWLGSVAYMNHGMLSKGIAYHFWANVFAGILAIELLQRSEFYPKSTNVFNFSLYF
ncbi:MAG: CPBP family intramembrane metalloprotease [Methylotenera sp.]|nr:CPBP family intramembrane metalloprotease [Oligoflexia bacterium]